MKFIHKTGLPNQLMYENENDKHYFSFNPNPGNLNNSCELAFCFNGEYYIKYCDIRKKLETAKDMKEAIQIFLDDDSQIGFWTSCKKEEVEEFLNTL